MALMICEHVSSVSSRGAHVELPVTLVLDAEMASSLELLLAHSGGRLHLVADTRVDPPERPPSFEDALVEPLTAKEHEVLGHLSELLTTEEIATAMFVSVNTVRTHVRHILRKLAVRRRNEAVRRARSLRLLDA
jgi:LuxR family transcriptional regulator, maltose regulon positive regulatory protein